MPRRVELDDLIAVAYLFFGDTSPEPVLPRQGFEGHPHVPSPA